MKKTYCIRLIFILALGFVLTGCALRAPSEGAAATPSAVPEAQDATPAPEPTPSEDETLVVANVNGEDVTLGQLLEQTATTEMMFDTVTGLSEQEKAERVRTARREALDILIAKIIENQKIEEFDIVLTDADRKEIEDSANAKIDSVRDYVLKTYPSLNEQELNETVESLLKVQGITKELIQTYLTDQMLSDRLYHTVVANAGRAVSNAALQDAYDQLLAQQKASFDGDVTAYESALLAGGIVVYRPAPCKKISQLYLMFDEDVIGMLRQLRQYDSEDLAKTMEEDQMTRMQNVVRAAEKQLKAGTAFDAVLETLSSNGAYTTNYVCDNTPRFTVEYRKAVAKLQQIGDVSEAVPAEYGMYLLQLTEVLAPGVTPFADVRQALAEQLQADWEKTAYEDAKLAWFEAATIEIFEENIYTK